MGSSYTPSDFKGVRVSQVLLDSLQRQAKSSGMSYRISMQPTVYSKDLFIMP